MSLFVDKNIEFTLFYGSLLGYVRDNDFLERDDDIDILIASKDASVVLNVLKNNPDIQIRREFAYFIQVGIADIQASLEFYFYDLIWRDELLITWDGNLVFSRQHIFPLKEILFHDYHIFIPNNSEKILEIIYGDNWRIPIDKSQYSWQAITKVKKLQKYRQKALRVGRRSAPPASPIRLPSPTGPACTL